MQKKSLASLITFVLLFTSSLISVLPVPIVHASPGITADIGIQCITVSSCNIVFAGPNNAGNLKVLTIPVNTAGVSAHVSSVTDTRGDTWTKQVSAIDNAKSLDVEIWSTILVSSLSLTVTVATSASTSYYPSMYEVSGITSATADCTDTGIHTAATAIKTDLGCAFNTATQVEFATLFGADSTITAGSGYTVFDPTAQHNAIGEYSTAAGNNPTFFEGTQTSANYADAGAIFGPQTIVTVSTVGACTFFQLQCWWYPLLFMMLYAGVLMLVATQLKTSPRGKAHIFLSAVTFGSLIAVILGIMNIVFPLLMLVINTIIALRLRG